MKAEIIYENDTLQSTLVTIDPQDVWDACDTIAVVALPLLREVKETKQGIPGIIRQEDVPFEYRQHYTQAQFTVDSDEEYTEAEKAWNWILDEMIWAMNEMANNYPEQPLTSKPADRNEMIAYNKRLQRGSELFGKYFRSCGHKL